MVVNQLLLHNHPLPARERQNFTRVHLLREDPDLGAFIAPQEQAWAVEHCVVPAITLPRGHWEWDQGEMSPAGIGLLVLDGLLIRRVGIDGRFGAELLGEGDLLRPWQGEDLDSPLTETTGWKILTRMRVAVLDDRAAARLARYPALIGAIAGRAMDRSRRLALMMAIIHHPRIDVRLHMLFWHLAGRWGHVRQDGVLLRLSLSHTVLADLIAAQRPSVTGALGRLAERGLVRPADQGWLLLGEPPGELLELEEIGVPASDPDPSDAAASGAM
jgi:CRP/FNR family cyclic AMP-dependent transcriptional regulator